MLVGQMRIVVNDIEANYQIDTTDRNHNIFFYEICPLLAVAEHTIAYAVKVVGQGGGSRYDGLILSEANGKWQRVECTAAIDGRNDALRMEVLDQEGWAPAFGEIRAAGTRRRRRFGGIDSAPTRWDEYDNKTLRPLLLEAVNKKAKKSGTNRYYQGAWLIIVFDDWVCPFDISRKRSRFDPICRSVLDDVMRGYFPFQRLFVVGVSQRYLFDSSEWRKLHR